MITLCDPRYSGYPVELDFDPKIEDGWMWWRGELREIREIHILEGKGRQIELFP